MSTKIITVRLADDLHQRLRERCLKEKTTMQAVAVQLLGQWCGEPVEQSPAPSRRGVIDWPAFERAASAMIGEPSQTITDQRDGADRLSYLAGKLGADRFMALRREHTVESPA